MSEYKGNFNTKIGGLLAAVGSAVGLGNVWRFPTETGTSGGATFVLVYVFFMLILGIPIMISELAIGRYGGKNVSHSFFSMSGNRRGWALMGILPVVSGIVLLSYYSVVAGWIVQYLYEAITNQFVGKTPEEYATSFINFSSSTTRPLVWLYAVLLLTAAIVAFGVRKGIERSSKILMPILFICLVILVVCSVSLPGASEGLTFFLRPDLSSLSGGVILSAMGQAFFSLSVGVCCLCTYGCYFRRDADLIKESISVASIDTVVALMAGLIIFPAVFSVGNIESDAGPSLVFITLPNVFQQAFHGVPVFAYCFSLLFYLLLLVAAISSSISILEMSVSIFVRKYKIPRPTACFALALLCAVLGTMCSLSFGKWSHVTLLGLGFFDLFDSIVAKLLMPIGAFLVCVFAGWVVKKNILQDELTNAATISQPLFSVYLFIVRYVAPVGILLIFLNGLGLF